ncbi:9962_t:CDS:2, partial [Funneliformis caledonium]
LSPSSTVILKIETSTASEHVELLQYCDLIDFFDILYSYEKYLEDHAPKRFKRHNGFEALQKLLEEHNNDENIANNDISVLFR